MFYRLQSSRIHRFRIDVSFSRIFFSETETMIFSPLKLAYFPFCDMVGNPKLRAILKNEIVSGKGNIDNR